jgi:PBSX family phage portal protein
MATARKSQAITSSKVVDLPVQNQDSNDANHSAMRRVRARIIEMDVSKSSGLTSSTAEPGKSEATPEEPFSVLARKGNIIEPPFDMLTLAMLVEHNSELGQVIDAMETNIDGTGHRFVSRMRLDDVPRDNPAGGADSPPDAAADAKLLSGVKAEKVKLDNFFMYATEESFTAFRRKLRRDLESTGNAYFEVLRNTAGEVQGFTHLPSHQIRLGKIDQEPELVDRKILELQIDGSVKVKTQKVWRRFRRFIQQRAILRRSLSAVTGHKVRWFKQFGDQRKVNKTTGEFDTKAKPVKADELANEMVHIKQYSGRTPYGLPRYIGNLLAIFGDRASEEINYITFRNNNIPSMMMMVSNGQLTEGTIQRIESFVESQIQGSDNYSKMLIIEAEPFDGEGEDGGQVKVSAQPLVKDQHRDALFQNYSANNQDKIRRAFRLPPIFVGRSDDYTRATAESSRRLADEQIFAPERDEFDSLVNRVLFPEMGIRFHKFRSNSPNTTDNTQLVKILAGAEKTGGMTPRIARKMLEDILGIDLPDFPADFPADTPFSLTMAEAVKNKADGAEPGQQVTALKALGILDDGGDIDWGGMDDDDVMSIAKRLFTLNKAAEGLWKAKMGGEGDADGADIE